MPTRFGLLAPCDHTNGGILDQMEMTVAEYLELLRAGKADSQDERS